VSARDEILARVRAATAGAVATEVHRPVRPTARRGAEVVDLFVERVADYRAVVERCAGDEVEARIAAILAGRRAVLPQGLGYDVPGAIADDDLIAAELDAIDAVVTLAALGIAETGTIVLDHGPGQGRRALTLVPDMHICVIRADQVVPDVPDAIALLDPTRPTTWISGPSATSDIELRRVEGVHGPRTLHVLVVPGDSSVAEGGWTGLRNVRARGSR
jgi:L-lactate dehydrogenase complex protein LldG